MPDVRQLIKATKRPPKPFADAPALFGDDDAKKKGSLKNRIRGIERLLKKVSLPREFTLAAWYLVR